MTLHTWISDSGARATSAPATSATQLYRAFPAQNAKVCAGNCDPLSKGEVGLQEGVGEGKQEQT